MNTLSMWLPIALGAGGYLIGSIPFGVVICKMLGTVDPRTAGSRNIGFTNVLRVAGKRAGILTLLGDAGKGWAAAWVGNQLLTDELTVLMVALSPILGHLYSIFLWFRGGKGVATAMGSVAGVVWPIGLMMLALWLLTAWLTRISSAGAIVSFVALPILGLLFAKSGTFEVFAMVVSTLILVRHKDNLQRLWNRSEPRMGESR